MGGAGKDVGEPVMTDDGITVGGVRMTVGGI